VSGIFGTTNRKPTSRRDRATRRGHGLAALAGLRRDTRGATVIEFAIVGPIFLLLVLAVIENGLTLFSQSVLDNATRDAARLAMTGQVQLGGASFPTLLCNELSGIMPCANLQYRVQTGSSFGSLSPAVTNSGGTLQGFQSYPTAPAAGIANQYVLVQVGYNRSYLIPWVGQYFNASGSAMLMSTQAFENEPY
jgi:Flp pilus assembly protein TadG